MPRSNFNNSRIQMMAFVFLVLLAYALFVQSIFLLMNKSVFMLKANLALQLMLFIAFILWTYGNSSTYLNAPLILFGAIYMWHSPFLTGHYFEISELFEFTGRFFNYGADQVYKAISLVGLCLVMYVIGIIFGFICKKKKHDVNKLSVEFVEEKEFGSNWIPNKNVKLFVWILFFSYIALT